MMDKRNVEIAVGQAINILIEKDMTLTEDNISIVMKYVKFILDCQEVAYNEFISKRI